MDYFRVIESKNYEITVFYNYYQFVIRFMQKR